LYGAADTGIPVSDVERMKQALSAARDNPAAQACQFVVYPDTPHAFHADYRPTYRAGPAQDGWTRAQAWFKQHL
jgi:carboxymethylenebutenolidase